MLICFGVGGRYVNSENVEQSSVAQALRAMEVLTSDSDASPETLRIQQQQNLKTRPASASVADPLR